jgi:putative ABC transport system permease protein
MFKNYLKVALRNLTRHKLYTFINVFGLSLGIACCILILLFIRNELAHDWYYKNASSMHCLLTMIKQPNGETEAIGYQPPALVAVLQEEFPEIQHIVFGRWYWDVMIFEDKIFNQGVLLAKADVIPMFDLEFVQGDPASALRNPNDIVVTESTAKKYFNDPVGNAAV